MLISQIDPTSLGTWVMGLALALSIFVNVLTVARGGKRQTEIMSQPIEVKLAERFVTREMCQAHDQRLQAVERAQAALNETMQASLADMRAAITDTDHRQEERARRIHERIDALGVSLSEKVGNLSGQINRK